MPLNLAGFGADKFATAALWSAGPAVHSFECVRACVCAYVAGVLWGAGPAVHSLACMRALL